MNLTLTLTLPNLTHRKSKPANTVTNLTNLPLPSILTSSVVCESTSCDILGHKIAAAFTDAGIKPPSSTSSTSAIDEACVQRFVDDFVKKNQTNKSKWLPEHIGRHDTLPLYTIPALSPYL